MAEAAKRGARRPMIVIDVVGCGPAGLVEPLYIWVLVGANGAAVARSPGDYRERSNAVRAARRFAAVYLGGWRAVVPGRAG